MTNYVKSTNFASKDSLASGNPLKIVKGTEIDIEFNNIAAAVATKLDSIDPALSGTPTAPTAAPGTNTSQVATTAFVTAAVASKANTASPTFTGTVTGTFSGNLTGNVTGNASTATTAATVTTIPTSQALTAVAGASFGAVGTYGTFLTQTAPALGGTVSGSALQYLENNVATSAGMTGTWRNMGPYANMTNLNTLCTFLRVS